MQDNRQKYTILLNNLADDYKLGEHPKGGTYIEFPGKGFNRICLGDHDTLCPYSRKSLNSFSLAIFAGDTSKQAKTLFKYFSYTKAKKLETKKWTVEANFHFGWQSKNIIYPEGSNNIGIEEYIDYWKWALNKEYIRQYKKSEFGILTKRMQDGNMMNVRDVEDFHNFFILNKYQTAITCPGLITKINFPMEMLSGDISKLTEELKVNLELIKEIYS